MPLSSVPRIFLVGPPLGVREVMEGTIDKCQQFRDSKNHIPFSNLQMFNWFFYFFPHSPLVSISKPYDSSIILLSLETGFIFSSLGPTGDRRPGEESQRLSEEPAPPLLQNPGQVSWSLWASVSPSIMGEGETPLNFNSLLSEISSKSTVKVGSKSELI